MKSCGMLCFGLFLVSGECGRLMKQSSSVRLCFSVVLNVVRAFWSWLCECSCLNKCSYVISDLLLSAVNRPTYMCFHWQLDEKGGWGLVLDGKVRNLWVERVSLLFSIEHRTLINGRHRKNTRVKTAKLGSKTGRKMPVMYREIRIVKRFSEA